MKFLWFAAVFVYVSSLARGGVPVELKETVLSPSKAVQSGSLEGWAVATDGSRIVTGAIGVTGNATSEGAAHVYDAVTGQLVVTLPNPSPANADQFGDAVAISGNLVVVGTRQDDMSAINAGSVYVFDLTSPTPAVPVAVLNNPSPSAEASFGKSVAISGTTLVVGTPGQGSGIVYVYDLTAPINPAPALVINHPVPAIGGNFGNSVAISGSRVAVGTPAAALGGLWTGCVYLFDLASAAPTTPFRQIRNPLKTGDTRFGAAVAVAGQRVAVGAYAENTGASAAGTAYLFDVTSANPDSPVLTAPNPEPAFSDWFAYSVSISGNRMIAGTVSGAVCAVYDGTNPTPFALLRKPTPGVLTRFGISVSIAGSQIVVGAPSEGGRAYVYEVPSAIPEPLVRTLSTPTPSQNDYFGFATAVWGDRFVVGALYDDVGADDAGGAYLFKAVDGKVAGDPITLTNPNPHRNDSFGGAVAIASDTVVIGAYGDDTGATDAGVVYVYNASSAAPETPVEILRNPEPGLGDEFGRAVATSGSLVVVGAHNDDAEGEDSGSVYVFDLRSAAPQIPITKIRNPAPGIGDGFGRSVAISGNRLVVGAYRADRGAADSGTVYVYDLVGGAATTPITEFPNPDPGSGDNFGWSVAIDGPFVAVGAILDDAGATDSGSVYVYDITGVEPPEPLAILHNPAPGAGDWFGASVAIAKGRVLVGASRDGAEAIRPGRAFLYSLGSTGDETAPTIIANPNPSDIDYFGAAVSMHDTRIVIGSYFEDTPTINRGAAYTYEAPDIATDAPRISRPLTQSFNSNPLLIAFTLFEQAAADSIAVVLSSDTQQWTLNVDNSEGQPGTHRLLVNLQNPATTPGVVSATGGSIPDGTYTLSVSYRDLFGHPAATATVAEFSIDTVTPIAGPVTITSTNQNHAWARDGDTVSVQVSTSEPIQAPTVTIGGRPATVVGGPTTWTANLPIIPDIAEGPLPFSFAFADRAGNAGITATGTTNGSQVTVDRTPPILTAPASVLAFAPDLAGGAVDLEVTSADNLDGNAQLTITPASGSVFPLGTTSVAAQAIDAAGNSSSAQFDVTVRLKDAVKTTYFAKGAVVPGAGREGSKVPAGAKWASFGIPTLLPSTEDESAAGFLASFKSPAGKVSGIFSGPHDATVARLVMGDGVTDRAGQIINGATFKGFKDPVFASPEEFAVIATVRGADLTPSRDTGIWARDTTGLSEVAREGSAVPGIDGVIFSTFASVLMPAADRVYFLASLKGSGVTPKSDLSLWYWSRATGAKLVQREGSASGDPVIKATVKSIRALQAVNGSPGHGRYSDELVPGVFAFSDGSEAAVTFDHAIASLSDLRSGAEVLPGITLKNPGTPSLLPGTATMTLRAVLSMPDEGLAPAILRDTSIVALKGDAAAEVPGAVFVDFRDPVTARGADGSQADLFSARVAGSAVGAKNDEGVWISHADDSQLHLVAREDSPAPGVDGAAFKSFTSLSLMSARGPLFTAVLRRSSRVKPANDVGVWGTDYDGKLRLLLREGDAVDGKTVKRFDALSVVAGSAAQQRAWSEGAPATILTRCFFTDGSQAIVKITIP